MYTISMSVMIACLICAIITTLLPIIISVVLLVRKKLNVMPYFIGVLAFFISQICLRMPIMSILSATSKQYVEFTSTMLGAILVGGLTAGLFEETARLISAKILLKKDRLSFKDGVSFGVGHALCEVIILVGISMVFNLMVLIMINTDTFYDLMLATGIKDEQYNQYLNIYTSTQVIDFIYALMERCSVIMFHIFNTLIVFYGVKLKKYGYYILAILLHTAFNGLSLVLSTYCGVLVTEIILLILSLGGLIFTITRVKSNLK